MHEEAASYPGESTILALRENEHLAIGAPFTADSESASFFTANDTRNTTPKIVKFPTHLTRDNELQVCQDLKLETLRLGDPCALSPDLSNVDSAWWDPRHGDAKVRRDAREATQMGRT